MRVDSDEAKRKEKCLELRNFLEVRRVLKISRGILLDLESIYVAKIYLTGESLLRPFLSLFLKVLLPVEVFFLERNPWALALLRFLG